MIIVGMNTHARKTKNLDDSLLPTRHNAVMQIILDQPLTTNYLL